MITKSRDDLRNENQKLKEQSQQKTQKQQQEYLFEIFSSKYGFEGRDFHYLFFKENLWSLEKRELKIEFRCEYD